MGHEAQEIIHGIAFHVEASRSPDFGAWRIGLTSDVPKAYEKWGCPAGLVYWAALTLTDARAVENYFVREKGMRCITGGEVYSEETARVCVFPES